MARILTVFVMTPEEALAHGHQLCRRVLESDELLFQTDPIDTGVTVYHWVRERVGAQTLSARLDTADTPEDILRRHPTSEGEWQHDGACDCLCDGRVAESGAHAVVVMEAANACGAPYQPARQEQSA